MPHDRRAVVNLATVVPTSWLYISMMHECCTATAFQTQSTLQQSVSALGINTTQNVISNRFKRELSTHASHGEVFVCLKRCVVLATGCSKASSVHLPHTYTRNLLGATRKQTNTNFPRKHACISKTQSTESCSFQTDDCRINSRPNPLSARINTWYQQRFKRTLCSCGSTALVAA